ncbi:HAD family hydrolase [Myroides marinus]|uniref:HAD family hydrolase n=1 Tax=Myroides marinus TaxID=703342 RepID=UPI0009E89521
MFDLDQTLVNTSQIEHLRKNRQWHLIPEYLKSKCTSIYPSIDTTLEALHQTGIKIAIVTSSPTQYAKLILDYHNLPYDFVVGYHDVSQRKPSPEGMQKVLTYFQITHDQAISFGDQYTDILASNSISIQSVACLWGNINNQDLLNSTPSFVLSNSNEILRILKI